MLNRKARGPISRLVFTAGIIVGIAGMAPPEQPPRASSARAASPAAEAPAAPQSAASPVRYLPVGDSYTIGQGVEEGERYPNQLASRLKESGRSVVILQNPARSGWTTMNALQAELPIARKLRPDFITLMIGTNDWVQEVPEERFRANAGKLLDGLKESLSERGTMLVVSIPDFSTTRAGGMFGDRDAISKGLASFNRVLQEEAAKRHVPVADIFELSTRLSSDPSMMSIDGLHPSGKQYQEWVAAILPAVLNALPH